MLVEIPTYDPPTAGHSAVKKSPDARFESCSERCLSRIICSSCAFGEGSLSQGGTQSFVVDGVRTCRNSVVIRVIYFPHKSRIAAATTLTGRRTSCALGSGHGESFKDMTTLCEGQCASWWDGSVSD